MKQYNGYRSWNAWNVSLWINNDEHLYTLARDILTQVNANHLYRTIADREKAEVLARQHAARIFLHNIGGKGAKTPDGAVYNKLAIFHAMEGMI